MNSNLGSNVCTGTGHLVKLLNKDCGQANKQFSKKCHPFFLLLPENGSCLGGGKFHGHFYESDCYLLLSVSDTNLSRNLCYYVLL